MRTVKNGGVSNQPNHLRTSGFLQRLQCLRLRPFILAVDKLGLDQFVGHERLFQCLNDCRGQSFLTDQYDRLEPVG